MEARRAVGIIIFEGQSRSFLMGLRSDGQGWGFAAGKQEIGDVNLLDTALRELREEFGVMLSEIMQKQIRFHKTILCQYRHVDRYSKAVSRRTILSDIFYLEIDGKQQITIMPELMDKEMSTVRWFTLAELAGDIEIFMPSLIALNTLNLDFKLLNNSDQ